MGRPTWRRLSSDVTTDTIQAHLLHIETSHLLQGLDVCFPVPLLRDLADEGVVGEPAPSHYWIMGFQGPDLRRLQRESCGQIARAMIDEEVDLALLVPVLPQCQLTAGLVAREIEKAGIPTVVLNSTWSFQRIVGMSRVAAIEFPMGRALGEVANAKLHREILLSALAVFETAKEPGWVEHLPFKWPHSPEETTWLPDPLHHSC